MGFYDNIRLNNPHSDIHNVVDKRKEETKITDTSLPGVALMFYKEVENIECT